MDNRIGVVGIVIEDFNAVDRINAILHDHASIIIGRMGIPYKKENLNVISLIIDGTTDEIGSLTGKLGNIKGVNVKTALSKKL